jgi:hypothetical protein
MSLLNALRGAIERIEREGMVASEAAHFLRKIESAYTVDTSQEGRKLYDSIVSGEQVVFKSKVHGGGTG